MTIELVQKFHNDYNNFIQGFCIKLIHENFYDIDSNVFDFNLTKNKELKMIENSSLIFKFLHDDEVNRSLEYTILPPYLLQTDDENKIYQCCPYFDNDELELATCLPFAFYDPNKKIFKWLNLNICKKITEEEFEFMDLFHNGQLHNVDIENAYNLALTYRILWYNKGIRYCYNSSNKEMKTNSLISFKYEINKGIWLKLYCLIDLNYTEDRQKFDEKLGLLKISNMLTCHNN